MALSPAFPRLVEAVVDGDLALMSRLLNGESRIGDGEVRRRRNARRRRRTSFYESIAHYCYGATRRCTWRPRHSSLRSPGCW